MSRNNKKIRIFHWAFLPLLASLILMYPQQSRSKSKKAPKNLRAKTLIKSKKNEQRKLSSLESQEQQRDLTLGIMLEYHHTPPSGKEEAAILQTAEGNNLVRAESLPLSRVWIFNWKNETKEDLLVAFFACVEFNNFPSIKSCEPNYILYPSTRSRLESELSWTLQASLQVSSTLRSNQTKREGGSPKLERTNALRECNIVKPHRPSSHSKANTLAGPYWAQNMIGADLLRSEIKKKNYHNQII